MAGPGDMTTLIGRLASFESAQQVPKRRSSSTRKKAAAASTVTWPHSSPAPEELAHAGFYWKPLPDCLDNVRCFQCDANIDGWESTDNPTDEHLALSPHCAWAIIQGIRMRIDNADRVEDDPMSEAMLEARIATFGGRWPYEKKKAWKPKTKKLAQAGWFYDPSPTDPDGTSCAYCSLSLDGWEQKDDPAEEHKRRSPDCPFFAMTEQKKTKAGPSKAKKLSTASSRASPTRAGTKRTRDGTPKEPTPELDLSFNIDELDGQSSDIMCTTPQLSWTAIDVENIMLMEPIKSRFENVVGDIRNHLTAAEKAMTVAEFVEHTAEIAEKRFLEQAEKAILAFEAEGLRAIRVLEGLKVV
ncbi:inhibitor of apoptosis repeat-containing protein [Pseudovirgaria hyperparasitica]|uniref:Inhibitor of apoptosis repeat-containing protein n=1 Tax=Pseudovirgaria hyperparasitica TaxID=470096 RepID=A0A6A6W868_9PEZI|nr:inhibitor of apoptosis repeat-containing protein [Pseudovirgaria hyperparasitica]KAF2757777.1 inhibitor of apoptosis repeat-containing protein [Pseudovirgaria hyperparasitica]